MDGGPVTEFINPQHLLVEKILGALGTVTPHLCVVIPLCEISGPALYRPVGPGFDERNLKQVSFIIFQPWNQFFEIGNS